MAASGTMIERRRASRIRAGMPLKIFYADAQGSEQQASGSAVEVSRCGARLRVPFSAPIGTRIRLMNGHSEESREFRVIRVSERKRDGSFELGVEILYPARNFWNVRFPDESLDYAEADLEREVPCR
jgi:hypothetical protein